MNSVMIYALGRTGSYSLCNILNLHPSLRLLNEPFNLDNPNRFPVDREEDIDNALKIIFTRSNAIKHVWDPSGWPFGDTGLNRKLVLKFDYVILLVRRCVFDRIVSAEICRQANIWHILKAPERNIIDNLDYGPLNEGTIRWHVENEWGILEEYDRFLNDNGIKYQWAFYEDIFQNQALGLKKIDKIIEFLGLPAFSKPDRDRIRPMLNSKNKIATGQVFSRIPNYKELREKYTG